MKTPEQIFVKDLEDYLSFEIDFNDTIRNKVITLLNSYRQSFSVETKIITQNFIVYKNQASVQIIPHSDKKILEYSLLQEEFDKFCKERNVKYENVKKSGRSTKEVTQIRKDFCKYAAENFLVSKSELASFLRLNHAVIHYYFNPKCKKKK